MANIPTPSVNFNLRQFSPLKQERPSKKEAGIFPLSPHLVLWVKQLAKRGRNWEESFHLDGCIGKLGEESTVGEGKTGAVLIQQVGVTHRSVGECDAAEQQIVFNTNAAMQCQEVMGAWL